ncbi:hypothetical protein D3C73_1395610 [compost metagenome]|jgi:tRNA G46 methylase TrmB|uniref:Uncharacterized protein n=1 Tax=Paenibacillus baimaensis TaxID=2982185 RepID=A0ABT2UGP7_9BACL|nr:MULTISPECIES: hypothetical protein [unclassified Paenibacillus]MCU6793062.1 hypothetical protein [Paenibacillus sp. WQ 127069]OMF13219.1 hypothetical protein BK127_21675 [Paenibacillus sp. FSL H7-0331]
MSDVCRFYVVYNDFTITICSVFDDVCEELAVGGTIYGYTDNEDVAHSMMMECYQHLSTNNM